MSNWRQQVKQLFGRPAGSEEHQRQLSLEENDNTFMVGAWQVGENPRDRQTYDRAQVLADCMDAWRFNPLARRITELTTNYVTGGGFVVSSSHPGTQAFLERFWNHR